jgi:hypothetical protein
MSSALQRTNYHDWVPLMRLHMRGLHLWDFLMGELPCLSSPSTPAQPVISKKTTAAEKERLLGDYEDRLPSYESLILWILNGLIRCDLFIVRSMSLLASLSILLIFVRSNFFARVTLQLRISLISFLLFGVSLTLLALSYPLPPISPIEIRHLHLSFIGPTTF